MNRRAFFRTASAGVMGSALVKLGAAPSSPLMEHQTTQRPLFVSTWPFGKPANEEALRKFQSGGTLLDAVEQGISQVEADPSNASVGLAGVPNSDGVVQLDACIMWGPTHAAGSVAALEGIVHPISVARRVMEKTPHVMLVGEGARKFALAEGFQSGPLVTEKQKEAWEKWKAAKSAGVKGHDTIAFLAVGPDGTVAGGCSTSGLGYKLPGRVGDSPIIGSGLYVDNEVGAAGATGVGENVLRYCGSFLVVEFMRQGASPQEACEKVLRRIARTDPKGFGLSIHFIAVDKKGRFGAAGTAPGFVCAVTTPSESVLEKGVVVGP